MLLVVSMGQAQANGGRAILGGGSAARHSRVVGLLRAEGLVGVQAVLVVSGDSTKHPETRFDCRLGDSAAWSRLGQGPGSNI